MGRPAQAQANLERDVAQLENARAQERRYGTLLQKELIAREQYHQFRTTMLAFSATVQAARAAVENAKASLAAARATIENVDPMYVNFSVRVGLAITHCLLSPHREEAPWRSQRFPALGVAASTPTSVTAEWHGPARP